VIVTWAIMAFLVLFAAIVTHRLSLMPSKRQVTLEMLVAGIDEQIRGTMQVEPGPYRALIGTIFVSYSPPIGARSYPALNRRPLISRPMRRWR
jgi:F0F1-type ATP synthase membrane subunit a